MKKKYFWTNPGYRAGKPLVGHHDTDYLIVGGGVAGLFIAYYLQKKGVKRITVLERGTIGSGSTGLSAGMLVAQLETTPVERLAVLYGRRVATLYARALKNAQQEVRQLMRKGAVACDYRDLNLKTFSTKSSKGQKLEKSISVNPVKFIQGMARYLRSRGVVIFENTPLDNVEKNMAKTSRGTIRFKRIAYAVGTSQKHRSLANVMTTICVTRPLSAKRLRKLRRDGKEMFYNDDEGQSYHYGKITRDKRLLVGYGDVRKSSSTIHTRLHAPHVRKIKSLLRRTIGLKPRIYRAWSASYALSKRPLPYVSVKKGIVEGAGTQIAAIAVASYFSSALLRKRHPLTRVFNHR